MICPKTVRERPCITMEIEIWLLDSRDGNNSVVDHRSRQPVLSPLCRHVWPYWASRCKPWRWMLKDISIHRSIWMGFDDLKHILSVAALRRREGGGTLLSSGSHESCVGLKSCSLNYELGRRWDLCSWIQPTLDRSILRLISKEPRLTCGGCLRWHPMKCQRVSRSGCSCSLASLHYVTGVPCMEGSGLEWHQDTLGRGRASDVNHSSINQSINQSIMHF